MLLRRLSSRLWRQGPRSSASSSRVIHVPFRSLNCHGCGATLQSITPKNRGFIPAHKLAAPRGETLRDEAAMLDAVPTDEAYLDPFSEASLAVPTTAKSGVHYAHACEDPVCERCYQLTHYGSVATSGSATMLADDLYELLAQRVDQDAGNAVIVHMVDLFDVEGTLLPRLAEAVGSCPVLVAGNKVDLLPRDVGPLRVRQWLRSAVASPRNHGLDATGVHLISALKGFGTRELLKRARVLAGRRREAPREILLVGAANAGKSTLVNEWRTRSLVTGAGVTTSALPGTTLGAVPFRVSLDPHRRPRRTPGKRQPRAETTLWDLPGAVGEARSLLPLLTLKELKTVLPHKRVRPVTHELKEGQTLLLGAGLGALEHVSGRPLLATVMCGEKVTIHRTKTTRVAEVVREHAGSLLSPPDSVERARELGLLRTSKSWSIHGKGWKRAAADVVFPGIGWCSVTTAGEVTVKGYGSERGGGVVLRDPLTPFEARYSGKKWWGPKRRG